MWNSLSTIGSDGAQHPRLTDEGMRAHMIAYFDACNSGDADAVAEFFTDDAVHYFPAGMYGGPFRGAKVIGERWATAVREFGSVWTVDRIVTDPARGQAVMEWSHFKTYQGKILRGDEWYVFHPESGLISEIRAYYASPQAPELQTLQLEGFDYPAAGYPLESPIERQPARS